MTMHRGMMPISYCSKSSSDKSHVLSAMILIVCIKNPFFLMNNRSSTMLQKTCFALLCVSLIRKIRARRLRRYWCAARCRCCRNRYIPYMTWCCRHNWQPPNILPFDCRCYSIQHAAEWFRHW